MTTVLTAVGGVVLVLGALVFATAALGVLRFPDVYTRVSAVGTAGGIGIVLVVTGALLLEPSIPALVKVVVIVALQLTTSSIGSIALARSAALTRVPMADPHYDETHHANGPPAPRRRHR